MSLLEIPPTPSAPTPAPSAGADAGPPATRLGDYFEDRAAAVDAGDASVRDGLAELGRHGLAEADIARSVALVRHVARSDMATAFSAWAHRMVIDYVSSSPAGTAARTALRSLATAETLGVTALAAGTAHVLAGTPLPVTFTEDGDELVIDGRIPWASNLIPPFLIVTAAAHADDPERTIVVALPHDVPGVGPAPFPDLLALGATGSTTVKLDAVRVPPGQVVSQGVHSFVGSVLARFLLLQGAFCSGLAGRAYDEAEASLGPMGIALRPQLDALASSLAEADDRTDRFIAAELAGRSIPRDELLRLRLRWSELAGEAVRLELAAVGGRGYLSKSPTARRFREAAFLPIQAPTEVMLRWLLSHSA